MVASVWRVANAGIVVLASVSKHTAMNNFAIRWALGSGDTLPVYFEADIPVEGSSLGETAVARTQVQHRIHVFAVLLGQSPE